MTRRLLLLIVALVFLIQIVFEQRGRGGDLSDSLGAEGRLGKRDRQPDLEILARPVEDRMRTCVDPHVQVARLTPAAPGCPLAAQPDPGPDRRRSRWR